ncbi:MAG: serine/threonine-protein kinase, partial [Pseudomonadota bacterium]
MNKTPNEVFQEYLKLKLEGQEITLDELIRRYPEHEKYLRRKFAALALISPPNEGLPEIRDLEGRVIDDFKIIKEISRGGMGVVYLAEQLSLARKVALKILLPSIFTDQKQIERFRQEGRAIAKLQHKGIVPVYLIGEHEGLFYIVMHYIEGLPLSKLIQYAKDRAIKSLDPTLVRNLIAAELPEEERPAVVTPVGSNWVEMACTIMIEVAEAVGYAHQQNIIHRDIKPSNIVLTKDGHAVLLDFGLSKDMTSKGFTLSGEFLGTPAYCAPELLFNKDTQPNAQCDVY